MGIRNSFFPYYATRVPLLRRSARFRVYSLNGSVRSILFNLGRPIRVHYGFVLWVSSFTCNVYRAKDTTIKIVKRSHRDNNATNNRFVRQLCLLKFTFCPLVRRVYLIRGFLYYRTTASYHAVQQAPIVEASPSELIDVPCRPRQGGHSGSTASFTWSLLLKGQGYYLDTFL